MLGLPTVMVQWIEGKVKELETAHEHLLGRVITVQEVFWHSVDLQEKVRFCREPAKPPVLMMSTGDVNAPASILQHQVPTIGADARLGG